MQDNMAEISCAIVTLMDNNAELDAICMLATSLSEKYKAASNTASELAATLEAIRKINFNAGMDARRAIDALCQQAD